MTLINAPSEPSLSPQKGRRGDKTPVLWASNQIAPDSYLRDILEVLSVPHRFLPDSSDSSRIRCIPEEWKLAGGSAKSGIPVIPCSGGILALWN